MKVYFNYLLYIATLKKKESIIIFVDFLIFLATVQTFVMYIRKSTSYSELSFSIFVLVLLTTIKFLWDCYKMYSDYWSYKKIGQYTTIKTEWIVDEQGNFLISDIKPSESEEDNGFQILSIAACKENVAHSDEIDAFIRNKEFIMDTNNRKSIKISELIKEKVDTLLPFLTYQFRLSRSTNKHFFNQKKLCLAEDINIGNKSVHCHQGTYYDTFLTNIISMQQLVTAENLSHVIFDGRKLYPYAIADNDVPRLLNVTESIVNNEIGISTLAFTKDHYMVLWNQNEKAQSSAKLLVPSGSGSCDWSDIVAENFTKTIQKGMNRELWEESSLRKFKQEQIGDTRVIGFFRWIEKAGKPEFVGITKMNVRYNDIHAEKTEVYSSGTRQVQVKSLEQLKKHLIDIKQRANISVPLFMNIVSLEKYIETEPQEVISFLGLIS